MSSQQLLLFNSIEDAKDDETKMYEILSNFLQSRSPASKSPEDVDANEFRDLVIAKFPPLISTNKSLELFRDLLGWFGSGNNEDSVSFRTEEEKQSILNLLLRHDNEKGILLLFETLSDFIRSFSSESALLCATAEVRDVVVSTTRNILRNKEEEQEEAKSNIDLQIIEASVNIFYEILGNIDDDDDDDDVAPYLLVFANNSFCDFIVDLLLFVSMNSSSSHSFDQQKINAIITKICKFISLLISRFPDKRDEEEQSDAETSSISDKREISKLFASSPQAVNAFAKVVIRMRNQKQESTKDDIFSFDDMIEAVFKCLKRILSSSSDEIIRNSFKSSKEFMEALKSLLEESSDERLTQMLEGCRDFGNVMKMLR